MDGETAEKTMNALSGDIVYPGLTRDFAQITAMLADVAKRHAALAYKKNSTCPWIVFLGGTGTGKSSLFNAFCGKVISETGVERPKTTGPIVYAHEACTISAGFPLSDVSIEEQTWDGMETGYLKGDPHRLLLLTHQENHASPFVAVDTPDLDSVEELHGKIALDLYHLSDAVVFVASEEKYADHVPCRFLAQVIEEERPYFFLVNKVQSGFSPEEMIETLDSQGIVLSRDRVWTIPYADSDPATALLSQPTVQAFVRAVTDEVVAEDLKLSKKRQLSLRQEDLKQRAGRLLDMLEQEDHMSRKWFKRLSSVCSKASLVLLEEEKKRFLRESEGYIHREIRALFSQYDLLAKPRRFIRSILKMPLELFGMIKGQTPKGQKEALNKVRGRIAFTPIQRTMKQLHRDALDLLSPEDPSSPLFHALRQSQVMMSEEEITALILKEQDVLDRWVEKRFERLAHELPKGKRWGIYSTSVIWGLLILTFEVIVGGGFTVLDAALDSVIAPFVTKGAVGLFASREIRKIAGELAHRYEQGLLSVIVQQKKRYKDCMTPLLPSREVLDALRKLAA